MTEKQLDICGFTHRHYRECINRALDDGYSFLRMQNAAVSRQEGRVILMRHDEDLSLKALYKLAKIENELGINSTCFIRMHAVNYNALSQESYMLLREMVEMGHEIGLHYELNCHEKLRTNEEEIFKHSKALLEEVLGTDISGMSFHELARLPNEDGGSRKPEGILYEAYEEKFASEYKYISDSSARWREGCMCGHIGVVDRLYILTHGFWWYDESPVEVY